MLVLLAACIEEREVEAPAPAFDREIAPIFEGDCGPCHSGDQPLGGFRVERYLDVVGCLPNGELALEAIGPALDRDDHRGVLSADRRALIDRWVAAGAPSSRGGVHPPGVIDPRSAEFHGATLRSQRYAAMLDSSADGSCARCHAGAPSGAGPVRPAPGATACTTCHDEPRGALACSTCHGDDARPEPPRDACFFPSARGDAHAIHVAPSPSRTHGLACATCHPMPDAAEPIAGAHADGSIDVTFAARAETFDAVSGACAVACHDRGGTRPRPSWGDPTASDCGSCHQSPPPNHVWGGDCAGCHQGAHRDAITSDRHLDGTIDLGNASRDCSACHGRDGDPAPLTGAHAIHDSPRTTEPIPCARCHVVPDAVLSAGHLDATPGAEVEFDEVARTRGASPTWDGERCADVACHGAGLASARTFAPAWADTRSDRCDVCHAVPPHAPHSTLSTCGASICHGDEIADGPRITARGRSRHVDGVIDYGE